MLAVLNGCKLAPSKHPRKAILKIQDTAREHMVRFLCAPEVAGCPASENQNKKKADCSGIRQHCACLSP
jgi:hypothetical protein